MPDLDHLNDECELVNANGKNELDIPSLSFPLLDPFEIYRCVF